MKITFISTVPASSLAQAAQYFQAEFDLDLPIDDRISRIDSRIRNWTLLQKMPKDQKKVVVIIYNYPPGEANLSGVIIYGSLSGIGAEDVSVSISAMAGVVLIGIGGARWLTNEVDKTLLKTAAVTAAASRPSPEGSQSITVSTPAQAFNIAKKKYKESL